MGKWTREHERQREKILEVLSQQRAFDDLSDEARAERRQRPFLEWCQTYLPHYFDVDFAPFHRRMVGAVGEPGMPTFVGAFRGAGKSVLLSMARPLKRALEGECPYFLYGSQVQRLAAQNMDYVRLELEHNERIRADYGDIETDGSEQCWVARRDRERARKDDGHRSVKFEAFGIGMSPRGRRHGEHRPVEFIGDDLEDAQLARNPRREKQLWDWMMDEVMPALEPHDFRFTVVGTMFGPGCMLERARELAGKEDSEGRQLARLFMQPATEEGSSVWPERFSDADLDRTRSMIGLRNWMRNFSLSAEDPDKPFQPDWMRTYEPDELPTQWLDVVAFLDPAVSRSSEGCPRALVVVGMDRRDGTRYVLDAWIERGTPTEMVRKIFEVGHQHDPRVIGVEENGGYALIKDLLEQMRRQENEPWMPVRYVSHSVAKELRIERLAPQMEAGRWMFPKNPSEGVKTLQDQFLNYPDGFVDGPDACAGCDELLPEATSGGRARSGVEYESLSRRRQPEFI